MLVNLCPVQITPEDLQSLPVLSEDQTAEMLADLSDSFAPVDSLPWWDLE